MRTRTRPALAGWLEPAEASRLPKLTSLAAGLHRPHQAVAAALDHPESTGQTTAQITRLTCLERPMDGRATFALPRHRFLLAS